MTSLVEKKEEEQEVEVDALFALGINVRCVDLSWTYDKVSITKPPLSQLIPSHIRSEYKPYSDRTPFFGRVVTKSLICV